MPVRATACPGIQPCPGYSWFRTLRVTSVTLLQALGGTASQLRQHTSLIPAHCRGGFTYV